jgi:Zn finger protein HypA/HybF involved in hydrogenase expression
MSQQDGGDYMDFDLKDLAGDIPISTECPICEKPLELNTTEFLDGNIIVCPHCESKIELGTTGL